MDKLAVKTRSCQCFIAYLYRFHYACLVSKITCLFTQEIVPQFIDIFDSYSDRDVKSSLSLKDAGISHKFEPFSWKIYLTVTGFQQGEVQSSLISYKCWQKF